MCICMYVFVYICPLISATSHIGNAKERYQRVHSNTGIVLNVGEFPKIASFKSYGVICLSRAAPASKRFFHHEISFYASLKPIYRYVFTAQTKGLWKTVGLWKTACDLLALTRETAQIYGSRILIAPPTSAYTQYK